MRVDSTGPTLSLSRFGVGSLPAPWEPSGSIVHAGVTDVMTAEDRLGRRGGHRVDVLPGPGRVVRDARPVRCSPATSGTRLDFQADALLRRAGSPYEVTASVHDQEGRFDRLIFNRQVDKGAADGHLRAASFEERSLGEPPFQTYAEGGGATTPVVVAEHRTRGVHGVGPVVEPGRRPGADDVHGDPGRAGVVHRDGPTRPVTPTMRRGPAGQAGCRGRRRLSRSTSPRSLTARSAMRRSRCPRPAGPPPLRSCLDQ